MVGWADGCEGGILPGVCESVHPIIVVHGTYNRMVEY